jgi:alpha-N-arabinofuranosidase
MNRRDFLKLSAAAGMAMAWPANASPGGNAVITVKLDEPIGNVSRNIYGHFIEHLGACVYGGIWPQPGLKIPQVRGMRRDVLDLIRPLKPPVVRWPGGCFSEYYHWEDGVGPVAARPWRFDWVWKKPEPNTVGTHEFMDFCREVGAAPVIAANARTGSPDEAAAWVRYCNAPASDAEGKRRAQNGHPEPFGVTYWDIGNEAWDLGVEVSARRFIEFNDAMKRADPGIKTVAVGSHGFAEEWDRTMLQIAGEKFDFIAPHHYDGWGNRDPAAPPEHYYANIGSAWRISETARKMCALLDEMLPHRPEAGVSMDEWGIWIYHHQGFQHDYDLSDGLVAASVLNSFQRLCRRMKMANWAQLVNCLGMINTDETRAWETPVATVFRLYSNLCREVAVKCDVESDSFVVDESLRPGIPKQPYLDVSATKSTDGTQATLCVVNRHRDEDIGCDVSLTRALPGKCVAREMNAEHWFAKNGPDAPQRVGISEKTLDAWPGKYSFPAHSLTILATS